MKDTITILANRLLITNNYNYNNNNNNN